MPTAPQASTLHADPISSRPCAPPALATSVLALTVAIYMITYMDRTIIASAMPLIRKEFGFSLITVGWILTSFRWASPFSNFPAPGSAIKSARAARSQ